MSSLNFIESLDVRPRKISELFGKWAEGLRVPVIQREFEWDEEDVKKLVDSIIRSYPIGTIILWETYSDLPSSPVIGPEQTGKFDGPFKYIIDGQQRLLSFLLMRYNWRVQRGKDMVELGNPISYNVSEHSLKISKNIGIDVSLLVRAAVADPEAIMELNKRYTSDFSAGIDDVGSKIANYEIPTYTIKTPKNENIDPESIAEIFTRINRSGTTLSNLQVFLAFFAAAFPALKDKMLERYRSLNDDFAKDYPSWESSIRTVFANLGFSQNTIGRVNSSNGIIDRIKKEYENKKDEISEKVEGSFSAMKQILGMLEKELGIRNQKYLPSQNALVPIYSWAFYNSNVEIERKDVDHIMKFLITVSVKNFYSTSANRRLEDSLTIIRDARKTDTHFPLELLMAQLREIHADAISRQDVLDYVYSKNTLMLLLSILHRRHASDWAERPIGNPDITIQHIFPREILKDKEGPNDINALENVTLINKSVNSSLRDTPPSDYLRNYNKKILESHMIPTEPNLWEVENYKKFVKARGELIMDAVNNLISSFAT